MLLVRLGDRSASASFGPRVDSRGVQALKPHPCGSERQSMHDLHPNFQELRKADVLRIHLPGNSVNKGKKKEQGPGAY
jgi:hypothetical protein